MSTSRLFQTALGMAKRQRATSNSLSNSAHGQRHYSSAVLTTRLPVPTTSRLGARAVQTGTPADLKNDDRPKSTKGLKPKILDQNPPVGEEQSEEVRKHNEDMANRAERSAEQISNEDAPKDSEPAMNEK